MFTMVTVVVNAVLFGVGPAWWAARTDPQDGMRIDSRTASSWSRRKTPSRPSAQRRGGVVRGVSGRRRPAAPELSGGAARRARLRNGRHRDGDGRCADDPISRRETPGVSERRARWHRDGAGRRLHRALERAAGIRRHGTWPEPHTRRPGRREADVLAARGQRRVLQDDGDTRPRGPIVRRSRRRPSGGRRVRADRRARLGQRVGCRQALSPRAGNI